MNTSGGQMLGAANSRGAENLAFEIADGANFRPRHEPEKIAFKAHGHDLQWRVGAFHGSKDGADVVCRVGLSGQQGGHRDVSSDLDELGIESLLAKEAAVLGDVKIDGGDTPTRIGDDHFLGRRLSARVRSENHKQSKQEDSAFHVFPVALNV